jgi:hypothetical protein
LATQAVFSLADDEWFDDYEEWHTNIAQSIRLAIGARFITATQGLDAAHQPRRVTRSRPDNRPPTDAKD